MKRVRSACICQTLHFLLKEEFPRDYALKQVRAEVEAYKKGLERNRTQYKILDEQEQEDGSILVKVIKQYNATPVGDYLN